MLNPLSVQITPPRVPFIDQRSGNISREWYLFFLSLFRSQGGSSISLDDVQKGPPAATLDDISNACCNNEFVSVNNEQTNEIAELQKQIEGLAEQPFGLIDEVNQMRQQINDLHQSLTNRIDQIAELQKQIESVQLTPPPREFKQSRYGQFFDTTTQTAASANTPYAITFNTADVSSGVYLGSPSSRIYVDTDGVYNIIFSIQLDKTSGGTGLFWVWPRINGVDLPNSNSQVRIQGNDSELLVTVGYFFELAANDYFEIMFAVDNVSVEVTSFPSSAFYPAIPSIILTVTDNIQGVQ
jgi:hypothetical protein